MSANLFIYPDDWRLDRSRTTEDLRFGYILSYAARNIGQNMHRSHVSGASVGPLQQRSQQRISPFPAYPFTNISLA